MQSEPSGQQMTTIFHNAKLAKLSSVSAGRVTKRLWEAFNQGETFSSSIKYAWLPQINLVPAVAL